MIETEQPRFTREEERELHARMNSGDAEAKELLARSVYDWAFGVALKHGRRIDREELAGLAGLGVAEALNRFDPDTGRLTTVVYWWVRAAIRGHFRKKSSREKPVSLSSKVSNNSRETIDNTIAGQAMGPQEIAAEREELAAMRKRYFLALSAMPEGKVKVVLIRRHRGETNLAIGKSLGVSESRAQQLSRKGNEIFSELIRNAQNALA